MSDTGGSSRDVSPPSSLRRSISHRLLSALLVRFDGGGMRRRVMFQVLKLLGMELYQGGYASKCCDCCRGMGVQGEPEVK
jgi:hypothetical protein